MTIRPFKESDRQAVITLWQKCGLCVPQNDPDKDIDHKIQHSPELFLVATENDILIGTVMIGYEGHRGWINYLGILPDYQNKNVGKKLMVEAENILVQLSCPKINIQVRETNTKVIDFYKKIGYSDDNVKSMGKRL